MLGRLELTAEDGSLIAVRGERESLLVELPSLGAGRALLRSRPARRRRLQLLGALHGALRTADVSLRITVAERQVASLAPESQPTLLSRLLGLGAVQLRPLSLLRAALTTRRGA